MNMTKMNKMIQTYKVGKGEEYTNTSMAYPKVSFNIPDDMYQEFLKCYTECVLSGAESHITEKPLPISPLRIDLDFRFEYDGENVTRYYTPESVDKIVSAYSRTIAEIFHVDHQFDAYLFEKPEPSVFRNKIKDGIHIIYPDIKLSYDHQHFIRSKMLKNKEVFSDIKFINKIDDVIDKAIIDSNCWLMYGSKKIESHAYDVTACYKYSDGDIVKTSNDIDKSEMIQMFSMRNTAEQSLGVKESVIDDFKDFQEKNTKKIKPTNFSIANILSQSGYSDMDEISNLMKCLDEDRANHYQTWMEVGWCLFNINSSEEFMNIWIEFSKKGNGYKPGECEKLWPKMTKKNMSIGTLKYWAKFDNPLEYQTIRDASVNKYIDICVRSEGSHFTMASLIAIYAKDEIVYDKEDEHFYKIDIRNIWNKDKEFINILCGREICALFMKRSMDYNNLAYNGDDDKKEMYIERSKQCLKIATKLQDSSYVKKVIDPLKGLLIEKDFVTKKLDANINLLAFNNYVYDMETCETRAIVPLDYIQITTGYDYVYDPLLDKSIEEEVYQLIESMFKTEEMFSYVLDVLTYIMYGKNKFQEFYIFTGIGSNGKSLLMKLIKQAFGDYAVSVNATTFTKESRGANETTEMYKCKGVRSVSCEEPSDSDQFVTSRIKEYSGDGNITVRGLFKNPITFTPQFSMLFACNDIPKFSKTDRALLRRVRIIEFPFRFCENPIGEDDKLIDMDLGYEIENDPRYKIAFMTILMENWNKIKDRGSMNTPEEVLEFSKQFIDSCNEVMVFIEEYYIIDKEFVTEDDVIPSRQLYNDFKFRTKSSMTETSFGNRLNDLGIKKKVIGKSKKAHRIGIKPKTINYESDDDE